MPTRPANSAAAQRKRARKNRVIAASVLSTGLLLVGGAVVGSMEPANTAVVDLAQHPLVAEAVAQGLLDPAELGAAPADDGLLAPANVTITSIAPNRGPVAGGQVAVITGTGFVGVTEVAFVPASGPNVVVDADDYVVVSPTRIVLTTPSTGTAGLYGVKVNATTRASSYTYGAAAVTSLTPNFADPVESKVITIRGTGFTGASAVTFNGEDADGFWIVSDTEIVATTPVPEDPPAETGNVVVTVGSVTSATGTANAFVFRAAPAITSMSSYSGNAGTTSPGSLTITGTALTGVNRVFFGTTAVTITPNVSATSLTVTIPARAAAGPVDVSVESLTGRSTVNLNTTYSYLPAASPVVTSATPGVMAVETNGIVLLSGTGFTGVNAASISCNSEEPTAAVGTPVVISDTQLMVTVTGNDEAAVCNITVTNNTASPAKSGTGVGVLRFLVAS